MIVLIAGTVRMIVRLAFAVIVTVLVRQAATIAMALAVIAGTFAVVVAFTVVPMGA